MKDGFIVDDVEDEEEEEEDRVDSDEERQKKKKRKKRFLLISSLVRTYFGWSFVQYHNYVLIMIDLVNYREAQYELDEDDYELLQDNNVSVPRPKLVSSYIALTFFFFFFGISS